MGLLTEARLAPEAPEQSLNACMPRDTPLRGMMVRASLWAALLQGGMPGAERLRDSAPLIKLLQDQKRSGRLYAAICAAPAVVFEPNGLLEGKAATSHPAFVDGLSDTRCALDHVWIQQNIVLSTIQKSLGI
jgi:transcriptional regulator GlxA family with amidase domain